MKKKPLCFVLSLVLLFGMGIPVASAASYTDVDENSWYAEAVNFVSSNGLMDEIAAGSFAPEANAPRAVIAEALWRLAGRPAAASQAAFTDVSAADPLSSAVNWAAESGVISGYTDGAFHGNDPVTREQFAAMLWRSAGSPNAAGNVTFHDAADISPYAAAAAAWAQNQGIISGMPDGSFVPKGNITRAMVASILMRCAPPQESPEQEVSETEEPSAGPRVLVACFSCTGNTERIAHYIADTLAADYYAITPEIPYTAADLNYDSSSSRTTLEQNTPDARPALAGMVENMADYDVIFLGYPIWWGQAPKVMYTFVEGYDLKGKRVIPFCTSGSSGIGSSAKNLSASAPDANWLAGSRFGGNASREDVAGWVNGLEIGK